MRVRSLCVYCGSRPGARLDYLLAAEALGRSLAAAGITLVYGGASIGVMGALADAVLADGGKVVGVIPQALDAKEVAHQGLSELYVVDSMHQRKALMAERADAFAALPGGIGTCEELFEVWTWLQLGYHDKPVALLNVAGYWDGLIEFLKHSETEGFLGGETRALLQVADSADALLACLDAWQAPSRPQWVGAGQT